MTYYKKNTPKHNNMKHYTSESDVAEKNNNNA